LTFSWEAKSFLPFFSFSLLSKYEWPFRPFPFHCFSWSLFSPRTPFEYFFRPLSLFFLNVTLNRLRPSSPFFLFSFDDRRLSLPPTKNHRNKASPFPPFFFPLLGLDIPPIDETLFFCTPWSPLFPHGIGGLPFPPPRGCQNGFRRFPALGPVCDLRASGTVSVVSRGGGGGGGTRILLFPVIPLPNVA